MVQIFFLRSHMMVPIQVLKVAVDISCEDVFTCCSVCVCMFGASKMFSVILSHILKVHSLRFQCSIQHIFFSRRC